MRDIFGTTMIITDNKVVWISLLQDNIKIINAIVEEEYVIIYTELGNVIISNTVANPTSNYIGKFVIDKEIDYLDFFLYTNRDYVFTENGRLIHEEKLEKTE